MKLVYTLAVGLLYMTKHNLKYIMHKPVSKTMRAGIFIAHVLYSATTSNCFDVRSSKLNFVVFKSRLHHKIIERFYIQLRYLLMLEKSINFRFNV